MRAGCRISFSMPNNRNVSQFSLSPGMYLTFQKVHICMLIDNSGLKCSSFFSFLSDCGGGGGGGDGGSGGGGGDFFFKNSVIIFIITCRLEQNSVVCATISSQCACKTGKVKTHDVNV